MENIRKQVNVIIEFNATTLEELNVEYGKINQRIQVGIEKMRESKAFSTKEIDDMMIYAGDLLSKKTNEKSSSIIKNIRENFEF